MQAASTAQARTLGSSRATPGTAAGGCAAGAVGATAACVGGVPGDGDCDGCSGPSAAKGSVLAPRPPHDPTALVNAPTVGGAGRGGGGGGC